MTGCSNRSSPCTTGSLSRFGAAQNLRRARQDSIDLGKFFSQKIVLTIIPTVGFNGAGSSPLTFPAFLSRCRHRAAPAGQGQKTFPAERPVRRTRKDLAARAEHGVGAGELVGWGADVHMRVVQDKILEVDELALEPQRCGRIGKMLALNKTVAHRRTGQALVEAGERLRRCRFYFRISKTRTSCAR
ncbi:hypothetical protein [Mesorhizobium sp.]|uniref:hypothetical protein n=1 Tax=Mesorhizobium sp. TaxID=1871066 RepID=UPI00257A9472|nr:hypothetical protein [Mesorhizobium sp.]